MSRPRLLFLDANVAINLALVDRLDLLGIFPDLDVHIPEEALFEVKRPELRARVEAALERGTLRRIALEDTASLTTFAELRPILGMGESACLALAVRWNGWVASDEKRVFLREARCRLGPDRVVSTPGLLVSAIRRGALTIEEADQMKQVLEWNRFKMAFSSFREKV